jgi:hypothetical protein
MKQEIAYWRQQASKENDAALVAIGVVIGLELARRSMLPTRRR